MGQFSHTAFATFSVEPDADQLPAGTLLIVDDIADNRDVLARRFRRKGFEIIEATCGPEALRLLEKQTFDCVLLDIMMPDMDGTEVLRQIRNQFTASQLPVIMVTAKCLSEDVVEALKHGANDFVTKPVDFSVALARVKCQIERRRGELALIESNRALNNKKATLEQCISERSAKLLQTKIAVRKEAMLRRASDQKIAFLAHYDALTGLPNRFSFDERLDAATRSAADPTSPFSLLFIDLDGFKHVNDTLGHGVGDELLKEVARHLTNVIGEKDFCARLGGDEFAIIHVSNEPRSTGESLAEKIIAILSRVHVVADNQVFIGASIGISVATGSDNDAGALLMQADLAMYRAKSEGRGIYRFFEIEMGRQAEVRRSLELDLRKAVTTGEFQLHYQPIVDLKTRQVKGVEALMRWNHPTRGFVSPGEFIPLAEQTGLIVPMGEWALRRACADAARWDKPMRVAVNVSPVQFRDKSLITVVISALSSAGLPADRLELEITEGVMLGNNEQNLTILKRLRELGVRIALDDFGTGFSGLGYIRSFKFDKVKIDQSFIRQMHNDPESLAIVRAAIGLGGELRICTTAEGVETPEQLESVQREGCTEVQGLLFSKPEPDVSLVSALDQIELMAASYFENSTAGKTVDR